MVEITLTSSPETDPDAAAAVFKGLREYNQARVGPPGRHVQLLLRDGEGTVCGGLIGRHLWGWLYVEALWIEESLRGRGWGTRLLTQAEAEARGAGCIRSVLDTFEFQALPFYQGLGYSVFGVLEDFPPGYRRFYLAKRLT